MFCDHYPCTELGQDVLNKYGNILLYNKNYFQCLIKSDLETSKCEKPCEHTKSRVLESLKYKLRCFVCSFMVLDRTKCDCKTMCCNVKFLVFFFNQLQRSQPGL